MLFSFGGGVQAFLAGSTRTDPYHVKIGINDALYKGAGELAALSDCLCLAPVDAIERATEKFHHHRFEK
jgi:hypothetical protein